MINGVIYCTTNLVNFKKYIGYDSHNKNNYFGSGTIIKQALEKYGKENFSKQILQNCNTIEDLLEAEIYWIDYFGAQKSDLFYNITPGGKWGDTFTYHPRKEERRQRNSEIKKGMFVSKKTRLLQSKAQKGNKNFITKKVQCEFCGIITTASNIKRWHNDNCFLNPNIDVKKEKIRRKTSDVTKLKLSNKLKNKKRNKKVRLNMSIAQQKRWHG